MSNLTIQGRLSSAVADAGTFTVAFPTGYNKGDFIAGLKRTGLSIGGKNLLNFDSFACVATSLFTITNRTGSTWAADSDYVLCVDLPGDRDVRDGDGKNPIKRAYSLRTIGINLGAPITADADGISASQSISAGASALLNGALLSTIITGRMIFDVPRNVVGAWTTNSVITVTGKDEYGVTMVEACASGATFTGKKAFKEITSISSSVAITAATFGSGDVLGLPLFLEDADYVSKEMEDAAVPTTGTFVAGVTSKATALTGDVRGTYDPNSACDGSKCFRLWVVLSDPAYYGPSQYGG